MKSYRLMFIDVDESFSTSTVETPVKGFMICRAPKGTTEATYFSRGSEKAINAMIGLQTANWPDLYEAIAFNDAYGLYISAPPGTSEKYPSYYGGVYITSKSMYDYWRVDDKDEPSYEIQLYPGFEDSDYDNDLEASKVSIVKINTTGQSVIQIAGVDPSLLAKINYMNFVSWDDTGTGLADGEEVSFHFENGKIKPVVDDVDLDQEIGTYFLSDGKYNILLGAKGEITVDGNTTYEPAVNTSSTLGVPYLNLMKLINYNGNFVNDFTVDGKIIDGLACNEINKTGEDLVEYLVLKGTGSKIELYDKNGTNTTRGIVSPFVGLEERMYFRVNIRDECFVRISQVSPNETPTSITISQIGYDKYLYDLNVKYILKEDFVSSSGIGGEYKGLDQFFKNANGTTKSQNTSFDGFLNSLAASNDKYIIDVISSTEPKDWAYPESPNLHSLWQYDPNNETWTDVTPDYKTKNIYVSGPLMNSQGKAYSDDTDYVHDSVIDTIWYIASTGKAGKYLHTTYKRTQSGTYQLQQDIDYNTLTISCKEEVYPGSYMSGGEFQGSLSETGVNAEGTNIYWPNVLPKDGASFIEVVPVHTFDELGVMNDKGFFSEEKLIDPIGPAQDIKTFTIKGQRTMTNAVQANIKAGTLGCAWTRNPLIADSDTTVDAVFTAAINDGLVEAQQTSYDDALIFMECSGQEVFKSKLMTLRTVYHDTCTIISPKIITKADFLKPETITVAGRSKGTAQYIGEFKMYDSYTGKYFWCQPIGDVGVNLARIMEKKFGGVAPAGTNDSNGLGGVLSRAVLDKKWDFSDDALRILDEKGLNPITYDAKNGLMLQSQKSTQDGPVTDWSYLGHSMSFDLCKREIRDNVMFDQLHKRINDYYYNMRNKQVTAILDKRTTGTDPIWAEANVDIATVNDGKTKAQRKFLITVRVKVYPYSDFVVLTFVTRGQE